MAIISAKSNFIELEIVNLKERKTKVLQEDGKTFKEQVAEKGDVIRKVELPVDNATAIFKRMANKNSKKPQTEMFVIPKNSKFGINDTKTYKVVEGGEYRINHFFQLERKDGKPIVVKKAEEPVTAQPTPKATNKK